MAIQKPSHTFTKIHLKALHTNNLKILFALSFTVFINTFSFAQDLPNSSRPITSTKVNDSLNFKRLDSISNPEIAEIALDTVVVDSIRPKKKEFLENIVDYTALDYTALNQREQKIYLYNEAEVTYGDINIKAGDITISYKTDEVHAKGIIDSTGAYTQAPVFKQGNSEVKPDSIVFNTKSQKALIYNSITEQGEGTVIASITKKENDSTYYVKNAKYTTSENLDDPEYYFKLRKAKVIPGKKIVTGLANLFIYDVPTPLGLPFGFFPQSDKQTSGLIIPTFGEQRERGYFLQNGGYYFALSDHVDLALLGDYYTNGSFGIRAESTYAVRYRFRGNFGFRFENLLTSEPGFSDFARSTIYNLRWSHNQDAKANPNSRFSASVNLGSSTFFRQSLNQATTGSFLNNTLASSVSYSRTFTGEPQVDFSVTATHSQNTQTEQINLTLPTFQGNVGRVFPFAPKVGTKKGALQNISFQYSLRGENRIQTVDSLFFTSETFDDSRSGFQHTIPISTNFKVLKHFSISASTNYNEVWTFKTIDRRFDVETAETITDTINGFDAFRTYNFSSSLGTTIYGLFNFERKGKDRKIKSIRHIIRPSISYNVNPAFDQFFDSFEGREIIDADGNTTREIEEFTRFEQSIFGVPNRTFSSSVGISLSNNFEAKIRDKDTTATEPKKITLLNNLNLSTAYNIAGDSLQWSPLRVNGGTQFFNNRLSLNFSAILDPYALDNNNNRVDRFNIENNGSLFRLTNANANMSYSLSGGGGRNRDERDPSIQENLRNGGRADDLFGRSEDFANNLFQDDEDDEEKKTNNKFYNFKIPWSLRLAYAINYSNQRRNDEISSHSLMFSGDIELSPKWSVGGSSGYDLRNNGFTFTQLRFARDLLSWRMNFSWVPFSDRSSWNFFIGIKSSILQDLKYEQRRQPDQTL